MRHLSLKTIETTYEPKEHAATSVGVPLVGTLDEGTGVCPQGFLIFSLFRVTLPGPIGVPSYLVTLSHFRPPDTGPAQ